MSREIVIDAALQQLRDAPLREFSLARLARALGLTTMALYTYFENRDALLEAAAERVIGMLVPPARQPRWQDEILAWLWSVQRFLDRYPVALELLAWERHVSAAWLRAMQPVLERLHGEGLEGRRLAFAMNWFSHVAVGTMMAFGATSELRLEEALDDVSAARPGPLSAAPPPLPADYVQGLRETGRDAMLAFSFARIVGALEELVKAEPRID